MTFQEIAATCSTHGLRPTQQRIAVFDYLLCHPTHPTVDTIYQALCVEYPTFSRTTIYNSLHALLDAGLIRVVTIEAEEQRFDGNPNDHGHFKCTHCGQIYDFDVDASALQSMCPKGFQPEIQDVFFAGICPTCSGQTVSNI